MNELLVRIREWIVPRRPAPGPVPAEPRSRPEIVFDGKPFLRPGEVIWEPFDWTIRPNEPAWCIEAGYPIEGSCRNTFAVGWGRTPDEARNALGWKLTERSTSGRIKWPFGEDRSPSWPNAEQVAKDLEHYRKTMRADIFEIYKSQLWPADHGNRPVW